MRALAVLCACLLTACGGSSRGNRGDAVVMTFGVSPESALVAASSQLQQEGFTVHRTSNEMVITAPRAVPQLTREVGTASPDSLQWILMVTVEDARFFRGSRVRLSGYLVPPRSVSQVSPGNRLTRSSIPVRATNRQLYGQIEAISRSIRHSIER